MTTLQQYRNKILNPALLVSTILVTGLLVYNIIHFSKPPYSYANYIVSAIVLTCIISLIFRKKIIYTFRAWLLLLSFVFIAFFNFYGLGYAEFGSLDVIVCVISCFVFLNLRQAIYFSAFLLLLVTVTFILYLNNMITQLCTTDYFINSSEYKFERLFSDIFFIGFAATVLYFLIFYFIKNLNESEKKNNELDKNNADLIIENEKRTEAEKISKFHEEKFRTMIDNVRDAMLIFDYNFNLIEANRSFYKFSGSAPNEKKEIKFLNMIAPEHRERLMRNFNSLVNTGNANTNEYDCVINGNYVATIEVNSSLMQYGDTPAVVSITRDITKKKKAELALAESEEKFRNLFNNIQDIVLVADLNLNILEVNDAFVRLTGISREKALKLEPLALFPEKYRKEMFERMDKIKHETLATYEAEYYSEAFDQLIPIEINSIKITYNHAEALLSIGRDLRKEKQNEKNILNAIIDAEEKQRARIASELHDGLGPLLTTIKLYLQWILAPDIKADKNELLSKAEETFEQAYNNLQEISNNLSPHMLQNFGLEKALHSFLEPLRIVCPVKFELECSPDIKLEPEKEMAIYRILTECINNTVKHSGAKNASMILDVSDNKLIIEYTDDGKGFDSDQAFTVSTGKGLYSIQTRLKSIGGTMNIDSKPGEGVKKIINIPL